MLTSEVGRLTAEQSLTSGLPVILLRWATANREKQGAWTESRTTIAGDRFQRMALRRREGCRGRMLRAALRR
jgi:hypothetical protein